MLTHTHVRPIEWGDCDPAGIVFHPRYLAYFDHCTNLLFAKAGFDLASLQTRFDVIGYPVVDLRSRFHSPCRCGGEVRIETRIAEFRNSSFDVRHVLHRGEALAVEATVTRVWAGPHPHDPQRLQSRPVPEAVKLALSRPGWRSRPPGGGQTTSASPWAGSIVTSTSSGSRTEAVGSLLGAWMRGIGLEAVEMELHESLCHELGVLITDVIIVVVIVFHPIN